MKVTDKDREAARSFWFSGRIYEDRDRDIPEAIAAMLATARQEGRDEAREQIAAERAHADRLAEALEEHGEHDRQCILSRWEAGRPTDTGGYEMCYAGKWYETRPTYSVPPCECGLDNVFAAHRALRGDEDRRSMACAASATRTARSRAGNGRRRWTSVSPS